MLHFIDKPKAARPVLWVVLVLVSMAYLARVVA